MTEDEEERTAIKSTPKETLTRLAAGPQRLSILVIGEGTVANYPLPPSGSVKIGRAATCEIVLDDAQVSRVHAELSVGEVMRIRDRGSANGTWMRDQRLPREEWVDLEAGDAITIGASTLILQRRSMPTRARRIWSHDYFEVRVDEECARADRDGSGFALARLRCTSSRPRGFVRDALANLVRPSDVIGDYGKDEFELLVLEEDPDAARALIDRVVAGLGENQITVRHGVAMFPADGRGADALFAAAHPDPTVRVAADVGTVISSDRRMAALYKLADRVAQGTISVLILGETGTGKEVLAQHIHDRSPRAGKPYLKLNCAALSETLLESELFGHERGAFTGAVTTKPGLLETADGGTVFLDELGELPLSTQVKLLRVLEERVVMRVGGLRGKSIDVRFVAATNRDLEAEIARGTFRQDLYFRLNGATLVIPPLRERVEEIPHLVDLFLRQASEANGLAQPPKVLPETMDALCRYTWPGNIRELRNVIERAVLLTPGRTIHPAQLPLEKMQATMPERVEEVAPLPQPPAPPEPETARDDTMLTPMGRRRRHEDEEVERRIILDALAAAGGNQTRAAERLGISRRTLINRLEEFGVVRPRKAR